ncbi:hypothetical protein [Streptomyces sp. NPDC059564]|uniref:hypothetical protein n=1 Tax=Streptomyces sp. NPDC059564 TaxID=3346865 RepID=UPI003699C325
MNWYNTQIATALRTPGTDPAQVAEWKRAREEALRDQDRVETATPDEVVEIAMLYAARLKELTAK